MRYQRRVLLIADDDARHSLTSGVSMEGVGLLFDVLTLAGTGSLGDGFAEKRHKLADAGAGEAGVGGEVALGAEFDGGLVLVLEDLVGGGVSVLRFLTGSFRFNVTYADVEELHGGGVLQQIR